jgi:branched-chain amino acid transport system permease protein
MKQLLRISWPLLLAALVPVIWHGQPYVMSMLTEALTIGALALSWAMLGNLGGMVSFGNSAFFGVGAYTSSLLAMKAGLPVPLAMLCAGLVAAATTLLMLPTLRLKGPYFALAILAYAQIFRVLAMQWESMTGGSAGLSAIPGQPILLGLALGSKLGAYYVILALVSLFLLVYAALARSDYGLALKAMHDSEEATRVIGVNSTLLKAGILLLSAFMTGVVGAFNAHHLNFLEPDYAFSGQWVIVPIIAAIFGGYRTVYGPVIGALAVYLIDQLLFKPMFPSGHQIILGVLLVLMILLSPRGLLPLLKRRKTLNGGLQHAQA